MILRFNAEEMLALAKAFKSGMIDTNQVRSLKRLADNFSPAHVINKKELDYYLRCLHSGVGYIPTDKEAVTQIMEELDDEAKEKWQETIDSGQLYAQLVRSAYMGMMAVLALGGKIVSVEPDNSFMDERPEF